MQTGQTTSQIRKTTRSKPGLHGADFTSILKKAMSGQRTSVMDSAPFFVDAFVNWRRQSIDIEVEFESEDASPENPENPITLISIKDSFMPDKAFFFVQRADFDKKKTNEKYYEEHTKRTFDFVIFWFPDEVSMLSEFFYFFKKTRPDMAYGWYIEDFDIPYIINRARLLEIKEVYLMSADGTVYSQKNAVKEDSSKDFSRHGFRNVVSGVTLFDMKWGYTRIQGPFPEGNGLNQVSLRHLGYGKRIDGSATIIEKSWYKDPVPKKKDEKGEDVDDFKEEGFFKFIIYGFYDVLLPEELEKKCYILFTFFFITRFTSIEWEKLHHFSVAIDMACLMYKEPELFLQSKRYGKDVEDYEDIEGGHVENPPIGMVPGYMIVADASRQYPNMIRDANLGVDTYIEPKDHDAWKDKDVVKLGNGDWFRKDFVSFLSEIVSKIFALRDFVDEQLEGYDPVDPMYEIWSKIKTVVKNLINAIYGANGNPHTRMFHLPTARSITYLGRELFDHNKKYTEIIGNKIRSGVKYDKKYCEGKAVVEDGTVLRSRLVKKYGDSITGTRCIAFKWQGHVDVIPIEEMWDACPGDIFIRGEKEVKMPDWLETINKDGRWEPVKEIIRHKTAKRVFRINQKNGETECTEDHSVMTEGLVKTRPLDLGGKRVLYLKGLNVEEHPTDEYIDLYELLKGFSYTRTFKGSSREYSWHKTGGVSLLGENTQGLYFGRFGVTNGVTLKRHVKVETLCKLLGIFASEGHVSIKEEPYGCSTGISNTDKSLMDEITFLFKEIAGDATVSLIVSEDRDRVVQGYEYHSKCYRVQSNNITFGAFFQAMCGEPGAANKKVPPFVFNVARKYQEMFYDYYFKGDGSNEDNHGSCITRSFTSKSLRLVSGLCFLMKSWGVDLSIRFDEKKGVYIVRERKKENSNAGVNKVDEQESRERYVYDLALSESHIFADACGMLLLHNTDSLMPHSSETDLKRVVATGYFYIYFMNKSLDIFCAKRNMLGKYLRLEFEAVYMNMFFPAKEGEDRGTKKQYCMYVVWKDCKFIDPPKFKMMGMAGKKSNTPQFAKNLQTNFLESACKGMTNDKLEDFVIRIIKECRGYLKRTCCHACGSGAIEKVKVVDPTQKPLKCSKCGTAMSDSELVYDANILMRLGTPYRFGKQADQYKPGMVAAKIAASMQKNFKKRPRKGETYLYFWTSSTDKGSNVFAMNPESPKVPKGIDIDQKMTVEKIVHDKLRNILPLFHIDWDNVRSAGTSTSLMKFAKRPDKV